jgi:hypothetical protein
MNSLEERAVAEQVAAFGNAVKLVALMQCTVEQMDTMKGSKLYRHKMKNLMKQLEAEIERVVYEPLKQLDASDEGLTTRIGSNIDMIMDMSLAELGMLRVELDKHRGDEDGGA